MRENKTSRSKIYFMSKRTGGGRREMENHEHQDYEFPAIIVCAAVRKKCLQIYPNISRGQEKTHKSWIFY